MAKRKDFLDNSLYIIANYIWWFIMGNVYFSLCSIFFILTVMAFGNKLLTEGILFFILSLSLEGPAIAALLSVMGKLVREKDIAITRDYFKAYKINFMQSLILSALQAILLFVVLLDLKIIKFINAGYIIRPVLFAFLFMAIIINLYMVPIVTRFYISMKDALKLSVYYSIKEFKITILMASVLILDYFAINFFTVFSIFLTSSLVCYIIMYYEKDVLKEIEARINNRND